MRPSTRNTILFVLIAAGGAYGAYQYYVTHATHEAPPAPVTPPAQPVTPTTPTATAPAVQNPVPSDVPADLPTPPGPKTLPQVDESDSPIQNAFTSFLKIQKLDQLFQQDGIIRRFVLTVDSATHRRQPTADISIFVQPSEEIRLKGKPGEQTLDPASFKRYSAHAKAFAEADTKKLVSLYFHYYKLFQDAYKDINPQGYFNDRLIEAIDHLIAAPQVQGPIGLKRSQETGYYLFTDEKLEALTAGQKFMIRIGPENARIVKQKLAEIRKLLIKKQ